MAASHSVLLLAGCGFFLSFVLAVAATRLVLDRLRRRNVVDVPNQRSSHAVPTPRGGGWGVVIAAAVASVALLPFTGGAPWLAGLGAAIAIAVALSWRDDLGGLPVGLRLAGHYLAAASALAALTWTGAAYAAGDALHAVAPMPLLAAGGLVLLTGYVWFVNLYNFMDGIDELTAVETASLMLGVAATAGLAGEVAPVLTVYPAILAGAALGFLVWNRHPAKVFLGDVGSIPLGLAVGFFLLTLAASGHPVPAVILPLYYVADATLTLLRRLARGDRVWQAHRSHWYQRAAQAIGHRRTVLIIAAGNAGLFLLALAALTHALAALAAAAAWTAIVLAVLSLCARRAGPCPAA